MDDTNVPNNEDNSAPRRPRAPTITIDTTAVNPSSPSKAEEGAAQPITISPVSYADDAHSPTTVVEPMARSSSSSHSRSFSGQRPDLTAEKSFDSKESRPTSPHNVSSPVTSRGNDRTSATGYLAVPGTAHRSRQNSVDSENDTRSFVSSQGETMVGSATHPGDKQVPASNSSSTDNDKIMSDEEALKPDAGQEADFEVHDNPFAYTPGQLNKMFNPKSLAAFYKLGGLSGLEKGLRTDRKAGLGVDERRLDGHVTFEDATSRPGQDSGVQQPPRLPQAEPHQTSTGRGDHDESFSSRKRVFKDNRLPEKKGKSLLQLMWITYNDKVLILLSVAAVVSLAIGLYQTFDPNRDMSEPHVEWVEGVAIMVAIIIVVIVGSLNDYQKELQFARLNRKKQDRSVKVVRSGKTVEISVYDVLVGDVVHLEPGDMVPVDGVLIEGFNVKCDESQATGESDIIRKRPADEVFAAIEGRQELKKMDPFIQSGARVMEGCGTFLVTSTGIYSSHGKTLMSLNEDPEITPLQSKLNVIATYIAKLGGAAGLLLFVVLFIIFLVKLKGSTDTPTQKGQDFLTIFIVVVTIIVVAVPEGLPLAVTLALAFATTRMLRDNNLVRHLKACEVMGNATTICSDKTGTLTQNKMQVVAGTIGTSHKFASTRTIDDKSPQSPDDAEVSPQELVSKLSPAVKGLLLKSIALNSTAFEGDVDGQKSFIGSKTEMALLIYAREFLGMGPVSEVRSNAQILQLIPFDSGRKCMGVVVKLEDGKARLYVKGASEIVLGYCKNIMRDPSQDDSSASLTDDNRNSIKSLIETYASNSLRTIGIIYRDFEQWPPRGISRTEDGFDFRDLCQDMVFIGLVGIKDPLRDGVHEAVLQCQKAGVVVRMVTGDNKLTAEAIAKDCGILQPGGLVLEGPDFRNMTKQKQDEIIPNLAVLARSSPEDKRILVKRLKEKGETVAVTGDGTNDAPALKMADVGFSMGIAGTEVAKEASAIILMDDNFNSIVKALMWGRAVNDAVKRFLQFQLTVNVTAVVLTFVSAVADPDESSVLTAVQLLWVNLIMDTLAALALATDPPQESVLDRKPERKGSSIISTTMWKMIFGQAIYQLVITFLIYFGGAKILPVQSDRDLVTPEQMDKQIQTLVFNTFVWMQIFNQWNNRRLDNKFNIFEGLTKNLFFIGINLIMCGGQVLIVFVGGHAFNIAPEGQTKAMWAYAIVLGALSIPMGVLIRLVPDSLIERMVPEFLKKRARSSDVPDVLVSDDERFQHYPEPFGEVRDGLMFLKRIKGGRINNLKFAMKHPRQAIEIMKSPSHSREHSRSNSVSRLPQTPTREDSFGSHSGIPTPDSRRQRKGSVNVRSRSNSALGATTVMAGIVAGSIAANWSPIDRRNDFEFSQLPPRPSPLAAQSDSGALTDEPEDISATGGPSNSSSVPILSVPKPPKSPRTPTTPAAEDDHKPGASQ